MRYAVFAGSEFYPFGGWDDHQVSTNDVEAGRVIALIAAERYEPDGWWQIVDLEAGHVVASSRE